MTDTKILIVEDELIVAANIEMELARLGYAVAGIAVSGEEAIEQATALRPDLVLMDIYLRGDVDGVAVADQIRRRLDVPVIYLTAYADEDTLRRAKATMPFGYLLKPFEPQELQSTIEMALFKHQMEQQVRDSEARYRALFDQAYDAVLVYAAGGEIRDANQAAARLFGHPHADLVAMTVKDLVPLGPLAAGRRGPFETSVLNRDGRRITVEVTVTLLTGTREALNLLVVRDITTRRWVETERERLIDELQGALAQVKKLGGLLPICSSCKKIRDDRGYWTQVEVYLEQHSEAEFTHGLCPDCVRRLYPELHDHEPPE